MLHEEVARYFEGPGHQVRDRRSELPGDVCYRKSQGEARKYDVRTLAEARRLGAYRPTHCTLDCGAIFNFS